jgi:hypothetical protein
MLGQTLINDASATDLFVLDIRGNPILAALSKQKHQGQVYCRFGIFHILGDLHEIKTNFG